MRTITLTDEQAKLLDAIIDYFTGTADGDVTDRIMRDLRGLPEHDCSEEADTVSAELSEVIDGLYKAITGAAEGRTDAKSEYTDEELLVRWDDATAAAEAAGWDDATTAEVERFEAEVNRRGLQG